MRSLSQSVSQSVRSSVSGERASLKSCVPSRQEHRECLCAALATQETMGLSWRPQIGWIRS
eukprot:scaffold221736_cov24-Tisochrysis_lutea.AAC.4